MSLVLKAADWLNYVLNSNHSSKQTRQQNQTDTMPEVPCRKWADQRSHKAEHKCRMNLSETESLA